MRRGETGNELKAVAPKNCRVMCPGSWYLPVARRKKGTRLPLGIGDADAIEAEIDHIRSISASPRYARAGAQPPVAPENSVRPD